MFPLVGQLVAGLVSRSFAAFMRLEHYGRRVPRLGRLAARGGYPLDLARGSLFHLRWVLDIGQLEGSLADAPA